jgi:hypothetical protein
MSDPVERALDGLEHGPAFRFADWPNASVPRVAFGVCSTWLDDGQFLYIGMARRRSVSQGMRERGHRPSPEAGKTGQVPTDDRKTQGLWNCLWRHASGRRVADRFCLGVCDRFLIPGLTRSQQDAIAEGAISLDELTRQFVRDRCVYRFVVTPDDRTSEAVYRQVRDGALAAGAPLLNPR